MDKTSNRRAPGLNDIRICRHSFTSLQFWAISVLAFIFAATAGSYFPQATAQSRWFEILFSGQSLRFVLLAIVCWFIHAGIKSTGQTYVARLFSIAALAFLGSHFASTLFPLLGWM